MTAQLDNTAVQAGANAIGPIDTSSTPLAADARASTLVDDATQPLTAESATTIVDTGALAVALNGADADTVTAVEEQLDLGDFGRLQQDLGAAVNTEPVLLAQAGGQNIPSAQELIDGFNQFNVTDSDLPVLSRAEERAIGWLNPTERQMFQYTMGKLSALQAGKIDAAEYMFSTMETAAVLANNGEHVRFDRLVGMVFSARPADGFVGIYRNFLGTAGDPAGSPLENLQRSILAQQNVAAAHGGFNPNITNDSRTIDFNMTQNIPADTVTHHFREFFMAGVAGRNLFDGLPYNPFELARTIDDGDPSFGTTGESAATRNESDIRNGMFAAMVGQAYGSGDLTSSQVVKLTEWAYTDSPGTTPPPWGMTAENGTLESPGTWLDRSLYDSRQALDTWVQRWELAHPNQTF
ncbi:MAG: hypothetical protein AB8G17_01330 [Gammaproteobacteria bacterium]